MKNLALTLFAAPLLLMATNASAQQVVEMPSINTMIEQNIQQAPPPEALSPSEARDHARAERQRIKAEEAVIKAQKREKEAQEKQLAREARQRQKLEERRHKEILKAIKKASKPKKFKPLKRVKTLPPNATEY